MEREVIKIPNTAVFFFASLLCMSCRDLSIFRYVEKVRIRPVVFNQKYFVCYLQGVNE